MQNLVGFASLLCTGFLTLQVAWSGKIVNDSDTEIGAAAMSTDERDGPARVSIIEQDERYTLIVNDKPYSIKGAGMGYTDDHGIATFAAAGGNTFRTWETQHLDTQLEAARRHGLMVLIGLDTGKQLSGFDYTDANAVADQYARMTTIIERYRNHPNVLGWILANEPNLVFDESGAPAVADPAVYDALGQLVDYLQENDPHHPVTISFAFTPSLALDIETALRRAPGLDFISLQAYGALSAIPGLVSDMQLDRPFMITEYGPLGHWEMPATDWGREIEEPSGPKAAGFIGRMQPVILNDSTGKLIGAFAFLWGQKQERTPTWYGLFTEDGHKTAIVDELTRLWTGSYPENRAPLSQSITLESRSATDSIRVRPGARVTARLVVTDPEADRISTRWHLMEEVRQRSDGGLFEATPATLPLQLTGSSLTRPVSSHDKDGVTTIEFMVPEQTGEYRLYAYTRDEEGGTGTANIPFLVELE